MQNSSKKLEINAAIELLRLLTKRNISQAEIGTALSTTRANISLRCKNKSMLTFEEIEKINKHFNVNIEETANNEKNIAISQMKTAWGLSDDDVNIMLPILENKNTRTIVKMLYSVLSGNLESEALIGILKVPEIAKTFIE